MKTVTITRNKFEPKQTLGVLSILDDGLGLFQCKTLELPWKDNNKRISCIPEGNYVVVKRESKKYGHHFYVTNVTDRSFILIHAGNYYTDIKGCILVGDGYEDINRDGVRDIINSKVTLQRLLQILPDTFNLSVQKQPSHVTEELLA